MKKFILLFGLFLILGITSVLAGDDSNLNDYKTMIAAAPDVTIGDAPDYNLRIVINEGMGEGFDLSIHCTDFFSSGPNFCRFYTDGYYPKEDVPLYFVSRNADLLTYNQNDYTGYVAGTSSYRGVLENGLGAWDFLIHGTFVSESIYNYSDFEPEQYVTLDFFLHLEMNETNRRPQGDQQYINGNFILFNRRNQFEYQNQRINMVESWQQTIEDWKDTITTTLSNIIDTITGHTTTIEGYEDRITALESCGCSNYTLPNYFKYLSSTDRKNIVCGYAAEKNMTKIVDLGYDCNLEYRYSSRGTQRVTCRCEKI